MWERALSAKNSQTAAMRGGDGGVPPHREELGDDEITALGADGAQGDVGIAARDVDYPLASDDLDLELWMAREECG